MSVFFILSAPNRKVEKGWGLEWHKPTVRVDNASTATPKEPSQLDALFWIKSELS